MRLSRPLLVVLCAALLGGAVLAQAGDASASREAQSRGEALLAQGDVRAARVEFMNAIKADPSNAAARIAQARLSLDLGQWDIAAEQLERVADLGAPASETSYLLAHVRLFQGNYPDALTLADAALAGDRHGEYATRIRAAALVAMGNADAGRAELEGAIARGWRTAEVWTDLARLYMGVGNLGAALPAAAQAVQVGPRNVKALVLAAELDRKRFGLAAAVPWYRKALEVDKNDVDAMLGLAATLGDAGANRELLDLTRRVLSLDQRNARAWYLQAVMAARTGRFDLARSLLARTSGQLDGEPAVLLLRGAIDLHDGAHEQAIDRFSDLVELQPANLTARRLLAAAYAQAKDHDGVIQTLRGLAARADADSYTLTLMGRALEAKGDRVAAAELLDRASNPQLRPPQALVTVPLAKAAADNANSPLDARTAIPLIAAQMGAGQAGAALGKAAEIARRNPGVPAAQVLLGDVQGAIGNWPAAASSYKVAANLDFSEATALRFARALVNSGDAMGAAEVVDLYLSQNPQSIPMRLMMVDIHMAAGRWQSAIAALDIVRARLGNRDAVVLNNLDWASTKASNANAGARFARAAYGLMPSNPAIAATYGWAIHREGAERVRAVALLEKAVGMAPLDPALRFQLAQIYAATGRKSDARKAASIALQSERFRDRQAAQAFIARL